MKYLYFTKTLQSLDLPGVAQFIQSAGLQGADLTVRPGYPVTPENASTRLPEAVRILKDHGLEIPLVSAPTGLSRSDSKEARQIFEACGKAGVPNVKIGYFRYDGDFEKSLAAARREMDGFARLAEKTGVKACHHTHAGNLIGSNCEGQRELLASCDPHHVGAYVDTGHQAVGGCAFRMGTNIVARWFSLVAIKDKVWAKGKSGWKSSVVPAGHGFVNWPDVRQGLLDRRYSGWISLHGEYSAANLEERKALAKEEHAFLEKAFKA